MKKKLCFFINPKVDGVLPEQDNLCLWTNCKSLIHSFLAMFEELWRNSTDIDKKILELKTGKSAPKTYLISDPKTIKKKYNQMKQSSRKELLILTSSKGLIEQSKEISKLKKLTETGITVKIMAPIVKENWEAMEQLSKVCDVRHVPLHYWRTIIIDGKYLLQFRKSPSGREKLGSTELDGAFYSDDAEWVRTMRKALLDIWVSAQPPSAKTLESVIGPYGSPLFPMPKDDLRSKLICKVIDVKPPGTIKEKDLLNKIIHAKKIVPKDPFRDVTAGYGSFALGIIHLPDQFNLPDMLIQAFRHEKQSSLGAGETIIVYLWLETPQGYAYVPAAIVEDNPNSRHAWLMMMKGTPAERNIHTIKKDQIQVQVHGNTLFAGWTVPIPLFPEKYVLPPACMLVEGYGEPRTSGCTLMFPSGMKSEIEEISFKAFVTFIHPATKYSAPGTDGTLVRDQMSTNIPPGSKK